MARGRGFGFGWLLAVALAAPVGSVGCDESDGDPQALEEGPDSTLDAALDGAPDGDVPDAAPDAGPGSTLELPVDGPGPFAVGYRSWPVEYPDPIAGAPRGITLHAWYPAEASDGPRPRHLDLFEDPESVVDAPARPPVGARYPVMIYSHGDRGFAGTSAFLMAHFASHGWLAVAPDHAGNLLNSNERGETVAHFAERPADISASLDALAALPSDDPLSRGDVERVVLSGHSRGVYTVWASAGAAYDLDAMAAAFPEATEAERAVFAEGLGDPRVAAVIGLAGGYRESWFGPEGWRAVSVPMQFQSGSADNPASLRAMFERVEGLDLVWVELAEGCHQTFALGLCGSLERHRGFRLVETYALAFARRHLLGDTAPETVGIVEGDVELDPAATVMRR